MLTQRRSAEETLVLLLIGAIVHLAVLRGIFPGYLDPLWARNDDFYGPVDYANRHLSLMDYLLHYPRPVGMIFYAAIGYLGLHGSIAAVMGLVVLNCVLTAAFFRRLAGIAFGGWFLLGFAAYAFLLFSEPYLYGFYTQDVFMHLSFFFLVCGAWAFWHLEARHLAAALVAAFVGALAAFLCKETYGLTALALTFVWFLAKRRERGFWRAAAPSVVTALGLALGLLSDRLKNSPFTASAGPYQTDLGLLSILHQLVSYTEVAVNPLTVALLVVAGWLALRFADRRTLWLAVPVCTVAATLAWVPNALIPIHYQPGYAWSGAYILFLPVLLIAAPQRSVMAARGLAGAILIAAALSPLLFLTQYRSSENLWMIAMEANQRNQLKALVGLAAGAREWGTPQHILVTGVTSYFTPFHRPGALRAMYPELGKAEFTFVDYFSFVRPPREGVVLVSPENLHPSQYAAVWVFNPDGTLKSAGAAPRDLSQVYVPEIGVTDQDLLIYPELSAVFPKRLTGKATPGQYYQCGTVMFEYQGFALAEKCFSRATELLSTNPYAFYFRGIAQERLGKLDLARASYAKAVEVDNPQHPAPVFSQALARVDAALAARKSAAGAPPPPS